MSHLPWSLPHPSSEEGRAVLSEGLQRKQEAPAPPPELTAPFLNSRSRLT